MQPTTFGQWIKRLRAEQDLTQEILSELVGCATPTLRSFEIGVRRPSRDMAGRIAEVLKVPADQHAEFVRLARLPVERATDDPPDNSATKQPANLPAASPLPQSIKPLIGREAERNALRALLLDAGNRLVTIVGAGGMGKTRLALDLATTVGAAFADGVAFVALTALQHAQNLPFTLAEALGISLQGVGDVRQHVLNQLRARSMLLVLDNFEHLLAEPASITWIKEMLQMAPAVQLLVTSRERLRISGERTFALGGLALPLPTATHISNQADALMLFLVRAQQADSGFVLDANNRPAIVRICQLLGGMPLGIELAAAWVRVLSCEEIADEVERNVAFLALSDRDQSPRHQSIAAVFEHSWKLLNAEEQQVLLGLSLFRGGCQREAAMQVTHATLPLLASLIDKSLLQRSETRRYQLHEVIRQLVWEQVVSAGQAEPGRERHLAYFYHFSQVAAAGMTNPDGVEWLTQVDKEVDNLRAALTFAFAEQSTQQPQRVAQGLELVADLYSFWQGRGYLTEAREWLERGVRVAHAVAWPVLAKTLNTLGWLANQQGETAYAVERLEQSLAVYRQLQDEVGIAETLDALGDAAWVTGDLARGVTHYAESLARRRAAGSVRSIAMSLYSLGRLYVDHRQNEQAAPHLHEALTLFQSLRDQRGLALTINALGRLAFHQQHYPLAAERFCRALQLFYQAGNKVDIAECFEELALVAHAAGNALRAATLWVAGDALRAEMHVPVLCYNQELAHALLTQLATQPSELGRPPSPRRTLDEWVAYALSADSQTA